MTTINRQINSHNTQHSKLKLEKSHVIGFAFHTLQQESFHEIKYEPRAKIYCEIIYFDQNSFPFRLLQDKARNILNSLTSNSNFSMNLGQTVTLYGVVYREFSTARCGLPG